MRKYHIAIIGVIILLVSFILAIYSNSPLHLRSLQIEEISHRNGGYANYIHTPYWYMELGGCEFTELHSTPGQVYISYAKEFEERVKNKPCTLASYYRHGPGAWLSIIALFLFILNFFDLRVRKNTLPSEVLVIQDGEKQKKYIKLYSLTALIIFALEGAMIGTLMVALMAWGESAGMNKLSSRMMIAAVILCPTTYLAFLWYGWGLHRLNLKKIVVLTTLLPLPFLYLFLLVFLR